MGNFLLDSIMSFLFHPIDAKPCDRDLGPSDSAVEHQRKLWREEYHRGGNIKQNQIAAAAGGSKSSKKLEQSSSEAMRVAEEAMKLLEKSKSKE
jgi:hypothetical protein